MCLQSVIGFGRMDLKLMDECAGRDMTVMMEPTFSNLPTHWCESEIMILPNVSDEGVQGTWNPGDSIDVSLQGGDSLTVTFNPDDTAFIAVKFNIYIDEHVYLGSSNNEVESFCYAGDSIIVDFVELFDLKLDRIQTLNGDDLLFSFIPTGSNPNDFENELRSMNLTDTPEGIYGFFVEGRSGNSCLFSRQTFKFQVVDFYQGRDTSISICVGNNDAYDFYELINARNSNGEWSELSENNSNINLTKPTEIRLDNERAGTYTFQYVVQGESSCSGMIDTNILTVHILEDRSITAENEDIRSCKIDVEQQIELQFQGDGPHSFIAILLEENGSVVDSLDYLINSDSFAFDILTSDIEVQINSENVVLMSNTKYNLVIRNMSSGGVCPNTTGDLVIEIELIRYEREINMTLCESEVFEIGDDVYSFTNDSGTSIISGQCDTMVHVKLNYVPVPVLSFDGQICQGESIEILGHTFDENHLDTTYRLNFDSICDTIYNISVTLLSDVVQTRRYDVCEGNIKDVGNGIELSETNTEDTFITTAANGCDSIIYYFANIIPLYYQEYNRNFCDSQGEVQVGNMTFNINQPTGIVPLVSTLGCDSLIEVNLTFNAVNRSESQIEVCDGETYFLSNGGILNEAHPVDSVIYRSSQGCDSTVIYELKFLPNTWFQLSGTYCTNEEFVVGQDVYNETNTFGFTTLINSFGCDSTVEVNLQFVEATEMTFSEVICSGESFDFGNGIILDGNNLSDRQIFLTHLGCDSILNYEVVISFVDTTYYNQHFCEDDTVLIEGQNYHIGRQTDTLLLNNVHGCDSVVYINLDFDTLVQTEIFEHLCAGESYVLSGITFDESNPNGSVHLTSQSGCDSVIHLSVSYSSINVDISTTTICGDFEEPGRLTIQNIEGGHGQYYYEINDEGIQVVDAIPFVISDLEQGNYTLMISDDAQCEVLENFEIQQSENLDPQIEFFDSGNGNFELEVLFSGMAQNILWTSDFGTLSCQQCEKTDVEIFQNSTVSVVIEDTFGCQYTDELSLQYVKSLVYELPNVLHPNTNTNSTFFLSMKDSQDYLYNVNIYNRWGSLLYAAVNQRPNEPSQGWNGMLNGGNILSGVYVYRIEIFENNQKIKTVYGDLTVIN